MRTLTAVVVTLVLLAAGAVTQERRPQDVALQAAIRTETVDGNLESAITQYAAIVNSYKTDRVAAYGLGALIAGGVAAKAGLFAKLFGFLLMAKKFIIIGVVALGAFIAKMFGKKKDEAA